MNKILYICDFFLDRVVGGAELNDYVLCNLLKSKGHVVKKKLSHEINHNSLKEFKEYFFIISNFINLKEEYKTIITAKFKYIIYEHDHKYLINRNPNSYKNYLAPKNHIVNYDFYKNAKAVITQSSFHKNIVCKNIKTDNIVNISGNLWKIEDLNFMREISKKKKSETYAIQNAPTWHKNTADAIKYCRAKNIKYNLLHSANYRDFLTQLGNNKKLVFLPKSPETLSRIVVESRMMNMGVVINKNIGASHEAWFNLKGDKLIDYMINKREEISQKIIGIVNE